MAIIEAAAEEERYLTPDQVLAEARTLGLPAISESAAMIRDDRDGR
jgi:hypothetical protein